MSRRWSTQSWINGIMLAALVGVILFLVLCVAPRLSP